MSKENESIIRVYIGVDHGNRQIKTKNCTFITGLTESVIEPPFSKNALLWNDKYYSLTQERMPYRRDKTGNNDFFVLTLFAIAEELLTRGYQDGYYNISLGVGLPLAHFSALKDSFQKYFLNRGRLTFEYKKRTFHVCIDHCQVYPQGYAAMVYRFENAMKSPKLYIVDIGGYTTDILLLKSGVPDMKMCTSLENGVITFYNDVANKANMAYGHMPDEAQIDDMLNDPNVDYPQKYISLVHNEAEKYAKTLIAQLTELKIDLEMSDIFFTGGGSLLLKPFISEQFKSTFTAKAFFTSAINDNAVGYEWFIQQQHS